MSRPAWLPREFSYADYEGDWDRFLKDVYAVFQEDFKTTVATFGGRPVTYDQRIGDDGLEEGFWHLTSTRDRRTGERVMDLRRCERVPWVRPIIENARDCRLSDWWNERKGQRRRLLWLEELEYLVILAQRPKVFVLITAYCTEREHTKRKLREERRRS